MLLHRPAHAMQKASIPRGGPNTRWLSRWAATGARGPLDGARARVPTRAEGVLLGERARTAGAV